MSRRSSRQNKAKATKQSAGPVPGVVSEDVSRATETDSSNVGKLLASDPQHTSETEMETEQSSSSAQTSDNSTGLNAGNESKKSAAGEKTSIRDRSTKKRPSTGNDEAQGDDVREPAVKQSRKKDSQRVPATAAKKTTPKEDEALEREDECEMDTNDSDETEQDNEQLHATGSEYDFKNTPIREPSTGTYHQQKQSSVIHLSAKSSDRLQSANATGDNRSSGNFTSVRPEPGQRSVTTSQADDDVTNKHQQKALLTYRSDGTSTPSSVADMMPEEKREHSYHKSWSLLMFFVATGVIVFAVLILSWANMPSMKSGVNDDMPVSKEVSFGQLHAEKELAPERFSNGVDELKLKFPSQTPRLWRIMESATLPIIEEDQPTHPAVVLLVAAKGIESVAECLARRYAALVTETLNAAAHATFNCETYADSDPDDAKRRLDSVLSHAFDAGSKSGVVLRLEKLPGPAAMIFYRFADNDNAPYKDVAIVLTLTLESTDTGSERDSVAYDELRKVWGASLDTDKVEPLLSRIGNSVAFVQAETKEALAGLNC